MFTNEPLRLAQVLPADLPQGKGCGMLSMLDRLSDLAEEAKGVHMAKRKNVHVIPRNDRWVVRKEGSARINSVHTTQREAIEAGREMARNGSSELVIHGSDGRIRDRDSYSSDPLPPKEPREVLFPESLSGRSKKAIKDAVDQVVRESKNYRRGNSRTESRG
jgi:Uncharacterized protein conserved in bacteria (DUF2188)